MILIIGGAFQGKTEYAKKVAQHEITDGAICDFDDINSAKILKNYHILVRRIIETGEDAIAVTKHFCKSNQDCVVILDEIGCGIIPLEKSERIWRETVGQCGCILAESAEKVIRLFCGIPTVIKGNKI